ncbi:MAG TPA: methionine--tRNA ligase [Chloroflexi bacterium]|jgi:methionyl-tRNA synthetase|nr:methionine--tRNA ligase [Chloroflexota bacterium]HAL26453.1 methionine--tRNA ligase [Chloroflexota bacterium]
MAAPKFYVTTAIAYVNDRPGLHHAYECTGADALARFHRQRGHDVFFLTGTDENAPRNEVAAKAQGISTRALVDQHAAEFKQMADTWDISYDRFIRTTDPDHVKGVQEFVRRWIANDDVYLATYEGLYCLGCEAFKEEGELVDGRCPIHPDNPEYIQRLKEENYFFRLSKYEQQLKNLYRDRPDFCVPEIRRNEVLGWLDRGLKDVSVSRRNLTWGIPFPDHPEHVVYVWFDALINYVTGVGFGTDEKKFERWWPCDVHVVGKDITRFHCIYWPAMLMAAGVELPRQVFAHGFLENTVGRLSRSSGNMIDPLAAAAEWGSDAIRYLVLREAPFEKDSPISAEQFNARFNADLANGLGNLVSRTLKMAETYCEGLVPRPGGDGASEIALHATASRAIEEHDAAAARLYFADALAAIFTLVDGANKHYQLTQPWKLAKDPANALAVAASLYAGLEALRIVAHALWPYMPNVADSICRQLGLPSPAAAPWPDVARWGLLEPGRRVHSSAPLFPRLEPAKL